MHRLFVRFTLSLATVCAAAGAAQSTAAAAPDVTAHYFRMKKVQIIDHTQQTPKPAYELMVPTTWQFKGWVNQGVAENGCIADWFSAAAIAKSADNSIEFQILPQFTFQWVTDPQTQRALEQENQQGAKVGMKPCPVRAPVHAADFLRHDLIEKYRKGKTLVSIDPFPELNQIARHNLGLPPEGTGSQGGVHTEAARARLAYNDDQGKPVEEWFCAVIVVRPLQGGAYDWHAINWMQLRTPKGQLDANDKLFKLIASTIHPDPEWLRYSSGVIARLYRQKEEQEAKRSAIIAQFQQHVADTINGVVANQQRGARNSAFGADQVVREVQTFRDPTTGATFELSNHMDHAWLNGSNEYVMSDDPNFNPNGTLGGSWTALEVVRPKP